MVITVAGEQKEVPEGTTVAGLIALEKVDNPEYVSVSVNEDFVDREDFETRALAEKDVVEFLYFMGGGR